MQLTSGGIIANYRCNASCRHCMYGSSPTAENGYMTIEMAKRVCDTLLRHGCQSVHIGGGEPFLRADDLAALVRVIRQSGLELEYIETNAGWLSRDDARNHETLRKVLDAGADCIMVSVDPFHIEFVPLYKPLALLRLLQESDTSYFVWKEQYLRTLATLDRERTYTPTELEDALGYNIADTCAREYGLGFNGRALNLLRRLHTRKPAEAFLTDAPCSALRDTGHFHIDFLGQYVPPRCTGIGIAMEDLGAWDSGFDAERYPVVSRLREGGLRTLHQLAQEHGFEADAGGYVSPCELCFDMRKMLVQRTECRDLTPNAFYTQDY